MTPCEVHTPDWVTSAGRTVCGWVLAPALALLGSAPGADCAGNLWVCGGTAALNLAVGSGIADAAAIRAGVQYARTCCGLCVDWWTTAAFGSVGCAAAETPAPSPTAT